jgi:phosphoribosylanthranilate isomerase
MVKVKVCGVKRLEDALMAVHYGADAVGLLVGQTHASSDFIDVSQAKTIVSGLPPYCSTVLVTHLVTLSEIVDLARKIGVTTIQLPGDISPEQIREIKNFLPYIKVTKAIHVVNDSSIEDVERYIGAADAILLDSVNKTTDQVGGTGLTHDWTISKRITRDCAIPIILAGGLNPDNVKSAIAQVEPYGVDANSGLKRSDGYKDPIKLLQYISRAKAQE